MLTKIPSLSFVVHVSVHVTFKIVDPPPSSSTTAASADTVITIGKPISDMTLYILDENKNPVPIGVPGELYVGGAGLAIGYLNRPELTQEKFVPNPFVTDVQKERNQLLMYKTGDKGRWCINGYDIEHMGRTDFQVKIRGFRIELSEIESHLKAMDCVEQAVVIDTKDKNTGDLFLAAYIVVAANATFSQTDAIQYLSNQVPKYMIPSTFNIIDVVPLTFNGKLDRRALPTPTRSSSSGEEGGGGDKQQSLSYVAPRNDDEQQMCLLWERVLGITSDDDGDDDTKNNRRVGINDNFFQLGGHSLQAAQLVALSNGRITVKQLHTCSTLAELVATTSEHDESALTHSITPRIGAAQLSPAPLSAAQKRLFVVDRMGEIESSMYHIPYFVELDTATADLTKIRECLKELVNRHHILRTVYRIASSSPSSPIEAEDGEDLVDNNIDDGTPMQYILRSAQFEPSFKQLDGDVNIEQVIKEDVAVPFMLDMDIPTRAIFYQQGTRKFLLLVFHHICFDGYSLDLFLDDFKNLYNGTYNTIVTTQSSLALQYADFAAWEHAFLESDKVGIDFWTKNLAGTEPVDLPSDVVPRKGGGLSGGEQEGAEIFFELDEEVSHSLRDTAKALKTTMYTVTLAAYYTLLAKNSGQTDFVIGSPVSQRPSKETQNMIGFFVNFMALRTKYDKEWTIHDFILNVRDAVVNEAMEHSNVPFDVVVNKCMESSDRSHDGSLPPEFQVQFTLDAFASESRLNGLPLKVADDVSLEYCPAPVDLLMTVDDSGDKIRCSLLHRHTKYSSSYAKSLTKQYTSILKDFASNVDKKLDNVKLLTEEESKAILRVSDQSLPTLDPITKTIHRCFEDVVAETPGAIALEIEDQTYSYMDVNARANRLARTIRSHLVEQQLDTTGDTFIALYLDRDINMLISMLAVLKVGAAYVPIVPDNATERAKIILEDIYPMLILSNGHHVKKITEMTQVPVLAVEDVDASVSGDNMDEVDGHPNDLAFVIYTSGTTGKPKGCCIEHRNVLFFSQAFNKTFEPDMFKELKKFLWFASYGFDMAVVETYCALLIGATSVLVTDEMRKDASTLDDFIVEKQIDYAVLTPTVVSLMDAKKMGTLKTLWIGGEKPSLDLMDQLCEHTRVCNGYGPTETTCASNVHTYKKGDHSSNIGRPIHSSVSTLVLDNMMNPLPVGVSILQATPSWSFNPFLREFTLFCQWHVYFSGARGVIHWRPGSYKGILESSGP